MAKQILKYSLIVFTIALGFLSWLSIGRAVNNPSSSDWIIPIIWFSLFFVFICLDAVIIKETYIEKLVLAVSFLLSFIFVHSGWHLLAVLLGLLFIFLAFEKINKDLELNIKISLWKTLRTGRAMIVLGLALMISSQYYLEVRNTNVEEMIPQFEIGSFTGKLTTSFLSKINPQFKSLDDEGMTVDEMIIEMQKNQLGDNSLDSDKKVGESFKEQFSDDVTEEEKNRLMKEFFNGSSGEGGEMSEAVTESREAMLGEVREQFSEIAGRELKGDEKVSEVLSEIINKKIDNYISPTLADEKQSAIIPMIIAIIIFITVVSLGSVLSLMGVAIAMLIFQIFVWFKLISIVNVPAEKEIIE
ncbi:MAG TPA: hypothetical protein ENH35_03945 [Candidatus Moranbacteria bacterium]|nr:hypothetical protein [Candidatus Moranbacteria bacterium]